MRYRLSEPEAAPGAKQGANADVVQVEVCDFVLPPPSPPGSSRASSLNRRRVPVAVARFAGLPCPPWGRTEWVVCAFCFYDSKSVFLGSVVNRPTHSSRRVVNGTAMCGSAVAWRFHDHSLPVQSVLGAALLACRWASAMSLTYT